MCKSHDVVIDSEFRSDFLMQGINEIISKVTIDSTYDIPYLAGYNKEGTTIYFDRRLPPSFKQEDGKEVDVKRFILLHEVIENLLQQKHQLNYNLAHQIALYAERAAVEAAGIDWYGYNLWVRRWIKTIYESPINRVPSDLDFQPYEDCKEVELISRMRTAQLSKESATVSTETHVVIMTSPVSAKW